MTLPLFDDPPRQSRCPECRTDLWGECDRLCLACEAKCLHEIERTILAETTIRHPLFCDVSLEPQESHQASEDDPESTISARRARRVVSSLDRLSWRLPR